MELHLSCTVEYYDARYQSSYTCTLQKNALLLRHANPLAFMIRILGEMLAFVQRYFLGIVDAHVKGIDASLNVRTVIRRFVALIKHRELAHCSMHLHK